MIIPKRRTCGLDVNKDVQAIGALADALLVSYA